MTKSKPWWQLLSRKCGRSQQHVLGSALCSAKFIPDFATITQPLWELTREKTKWTWTEEEQTAFDEVKRRLTAAPIMAYYRLDADPRIVTDASPVGLGAVLQQTMHSIGRYTMQAGSSVMLKQGILSLRGKPWLLNGHATSSICTCVAASLKYILIIKR